MLEPLLWIIGCYAACIGMVHLAHLLNKQGPGQRETWVVLTRNHQHKVEWMLRTLLFVSWVKGRAINLIVIDQGSTDATMRIVERIAQHYPMHWAVVHTREELNRELQALADTGVNVLDLERTDSPQAVPQFR